LKKKTKKVKPKSTKITDVTDPGKTTPSPTSRPIVLANRPVLAGDPMIVSQAQEPVPAPTAHTTRALAPVSAEVQALDSEASASAHQVSTMTGTPQPSLARDDARAEAEDASAEAKEARELAAEEARKHELEQLIATGKYAVPINAVQRKRSHIFVAGMCLLAVALAVVLVDVVLDVGLVKASFIPHTSFF
jgi:hypothetical protein